MDLALGGKVVWITGASGGIGRALAEAFAAEGAHLALQAHRGGAELEAWAAGANLDPEPLLLTADVADGEALDRASHAIVRRFGRIDVCAANAGTWPPEDVPLHRMSPERLSQTLAVDLTGALLTARAFLARLAESGPRPDGHGASLTFTGSTAGVFGERGHVDYAAAKAGLVGAVKTLKNEIVALDPYGRCNLVHPGWTVTHMAKPALAVPGAIERVTQTMALRQLGRARDVARAVVFLSSPTAARHVTGEAVTVAGGMEGRRLWSEDEVDAEEVRRRLADDRS